MKSRKDWRYSLETYKLFDLLIKILEIKITMWFYFERLLDLFNVILNKRVYFLLKANKISFIEIKFIDKRIYNQN